MCHHKVRAGFRGDRELERDVHERVDGVQDQQRHRCAPPDVGHAEQMQSTHGCVPESALHHDAEVRLRAGQMLVQPSLEDEAARRREPLEATAQEIARATNRKIIPIVADLTKDEDAKNFVEKGHAALGRVDIMVNNAGSAPGGVIEHLSEADWAQSLQLKFMGYVRCLRYVLPIMMKQGGGRVVNLIGNDGVKPSYWEIAPGAANAAGQNLTLSLAGQYGRHNISFCAVNPGPVRTERWAGLVKAMSRDMKIPYEQADTLAPKSIPMGRIAEVDEVANLVVMLASPLMHMVNGTMIEIDGGQDKPLMDRFRDKNRS